MYIYICICICIFCWSDDESSVDPAPCLRPWTQARPIDPKEKMYKESWALESFRWSMGDQESITGSSIHNDIFLSMVS